MPASEPLERRQLRHALRALTSRIKNSQVLEFYQNTAKAYDIDILLMELGQSKSRPIFFIPCPASLLLTPSDAYEEEGREFHDFDAFHPDDKSPMTCAYWLTGFVLGYAYACLRGAGHEELYKLGERCIDDTPFKGLHQFQSPEWVTRWAIQVAEGSQTRIKAFTYHNMNGTDNKILRGEVMVVLRLMIAQLRRVRYIEQLTAPVKLTDTLGPS
ncbi:uncharacterized protein BO95DRAFT_510553 [Aspergillus brunneoviolaceus CBS 621.78]|uniref:Uncharacterized protein n=1 Tax=Aspergillus brunneoviolaceus CBS 621.78 TaxID=1450534 RepID=A0ACD1GMG2_9EURO|nr:hypothetical protein BO95DRAFT_510553 [Aspergillus brunneoviolaceus CBS 621.78]RAH50458.1 hypothetical protein BO95DRAFT_510553 [Aspergillus brunneoviolaceus CBS 621.78]